MTLRRTLALLSCSAALCLVPHYRTVSRRAIRVDATAELDAYKLKVAQSSVSLMRDLVETKPELVAKVDEIAVMLQALDAGSKDVVAESVPVAETAVQAAAEEVPVSVKDMVLKSVRQDAAPAPAPETAPPPPMQSVEDASVKKLVLKAVRQANGVSEGATAPAETAQYVAFRSPDLDYTIWLNKDDPRNSFYEYDKKK